LARVLLLLQWHYRTLPLFVLAGAGRGVCGPLSGDAPSLHCHLARLLFRALARAFNRRVYLGRSLGVTAGCRHSLWRARRWCSLSDRVFALDTALLNFATPTIWAVVTYNHFFAFFFFFAVFAAFLNAAALGAPRVPGFLILSPEPAAMRLRLAWMFAYKPLAGILLAALAFFLHASHYLFLAFFFAVSDS
jgi:hypothetical protein